MGYAKTIIPDCQYKILKTQYLKQNKQLIISKLNKIRCHKKKSI